MKKYLPHIFLLLSFLLFTFKGITILDPDFGWHLKMGEYIVKHGLPATDPFSYTMPSYPFIDHEWLMNIGFYLLFGWIGMAGLAILFSLLATVVVAAVLRGKKGWWGVVYGGVLFCVFYPFAGVRPQVLTWLFTAVFLYVLEEKKQQRWWLAPITLLWVNLHGGFFIGVGIVGVYLVAALIERKDIRSSLLLFVLILLATLMNPYGGRIWWEVYMQLTDASLRFFISEWMPAFSFLNFVYWFYVVFAAVVVAKYRAGIPLFQKLLFWIFLAAGLSSMRNIPLWLIVSVYPFTQGLNIFLKEARKTGQRRERLGFILARLSKLAIFIIILQLGIMMADSLSPIPYPEKAVGYIKTRKLAGQIIAAYGWGGYLDWKLPDRRVFIDGRMPSWRRVMAPLGESINARGEYELFFKDANHMKSIGQKYQIHYVLIQSAPQPTAMGVWMMKLFSLKPKKKSPVYSLPVVYDDGVATIRAL